MTDELKPCPFCGDAGGVFHSYHEDDSRYPRDFWHVKVECYGCDASPFGWRRYGKIEQRVPNRHVKQEAEAEAIGAWNTRATDTQVKHSELADRLEAAIADYDDVTDDTAEAALAAFTWDNRAAIIAALRQAPDAQGKLFDAIAHGDAAHRAWLEQAIDDFFAGRPVQPSVGKGNKDARIETLDTQLSKLVSAWSPMAIAVMHQMSSELAYPASMIAVDAQTESGIEITEKQALQIMRAFRTLGIADYGSLYDDDSTYIKGRGYWLSSRGYQLRSALDGMGEQK